MATVPSQEGFPCSGDGASEQPWHELLEALMGCRGSSILFSQEGRLSWTGGIPQYGSDGGWHQVNVCEQQACSCRHCDDFSWPQASAQRLLPAAASMQTNPAFPWAIKGRTLLSAMQTSQAILQVTALATTLGQSLWVRCLRERPIFQSSLCLDEEKAGILSLTNALPYITGC